MLNIEKVKSMTKAAAYENGPEKKNIEISSYYRVDYIGLQMLKSGVAYAAAFCIMVAMWAFGRINELMLMISMADYMEGFIKTMILLFLSGLVIYECAVYVYYSSKYKKAKKSLKGYNFHLKQIHKFYETQESAEVSPDRKGKADGESRL